MYTPLRYQATHADCFPTSVLNALAWLFERHELPGAALQRIYSYCLDGIEHGVAGCYTSEHAAFALIDWLTEFRTPAFAVAAEVVVGADLNLRRSGRLRRGLDHGGIAILDVIETSATTHSILALKADARGVKCWDPYIRPATYDYGRGGLRLESDGHAPNLQLANAALDSTRVRPYALGPLRRRTGILIWRTARRARRRPAHAP